MGEEDLARKLQETRDWLDTVPTLEFIYNSEAAICDTGLFGTCRIEKLTKRDGYGFPPK